MLEKSLNKIKKYQNLKQVAVELAKIGQPIVESNYKTATEQDKDFITVIEEKPDGATLTVMGEDVMFREFGTGVDTAEAYQQAEGLPPIRQGSWSEEHAKQFSEKGYWYYKGERLTGTPPTNGMYYAALTMREHLADEIKEWLK